MASPFADNVPCLSGQDFVNILLTELPVYVKEVLRDVRPTDMLAAHVSTGTWEPFSGVSQTQDRLTHVYPNTTAAWEDVTEASCAGKPCDPAMNEICWGWKRLTFGQQRQSWKSPLMCFDQMISATKAVENIEYYISGILRPASAAVTSMYVRKKALELAGRKLLADSTMSTFTGTWEQDGNQEVFFTPSALPTSKLTPEMIKRQIPYLRNIGYFGKWTNDPFFGGYDNFAELITDDDTCWELDKIAANQRVSDLWRFQMWDAAHEYYKYGMGGQIGNYMTHVDPFCLRFNKNTYYAGTTKLQLVLPYRNDVTVNEGLGDTVNEDYLNAQYQISFIWHRFSWELLYQQLEQINPMMPFLVRDLTGQWQFATNDLGQDCDGNTISNFRKNKGFFWADWRLAGRPRYTEWLTAILHLREPAVIYVIAPCQADPGYPSQFYQSSCGVDCADQLVWFDPQANGSGHFVLSANSVTCNGEIINNAAIDAASLAALVTALNSSTLLGLLGTWAASGTRLTLANATCTPALPWQV